MEEEKDLKQKAKEVINSELDIRELIGYYNMYSATELWKFHPGDPEWANTCLTLVKEKLFERGIISSPKIEKLSSGPDITLTTGLIVRVDEENNKFEFVQDDYDMEADMNNCQELKILVGNHDMATELYRALCNVDWYKNGIRWSCSWRYAGGIVADLRNVGEDYLDFYCSGDEGLVNPTIQETLAKIGWSPNKL